MTVLTRKGLKLNFYPGRHGLPRIDPMDSVLTEITGLTQNGLKLNFYFGRHGLTRIDPMGSFFMEDDS